MTMEPKERMLLEGVLGAVLIAFLILASIMIVSAYRDPETTTTITNSYNTNSYNTDSFNTYSTQGYAQRLPSVYTTQTTSYPSKKYGTQTYTKPYIVDRTDYAKVYYTKSYSDDRYLRYYDSGSFRSYKGLVGNRVDSYEVYVTNREYTGGNFETTFYFEDYYGNVDSKSETYYIPAREEKTFVFRDVSPTNYQYRRWRYEVTPLTKVPTVNYYDDGHYYYGNTPYRTYYDGYYSGY